MAQCRLRHIFHIVHLIEIAVLYILPDVWDDGKNRLSIINLSASAKNQSDVWNWARGMQVSRIFHMTEAGFAEKF